MFYKIWTDSEEGKNDYKRIDVRLELQSLCTEKSLRRHYSMEHSSELLHEYLPQLPERSAAQTAQLQQHAA